MGVPVTTLLILDVFLSTTRIHDMGKHLFYTNFACKKIWNFAQLGIWKISLTYSIVIMFWGRPWAPMNDTKIRTRDPIDGYSNCGSLKLKTLAMTLYWHRWINIALIKTIPIRKQMTSDIYPVFNYHFVRLKHGHYHIKSSEELSNMMSFMLPWEVHKCKRLPQGMSTSIHAQILLPPLLCHLILSD